MPHTPCSCRSFPAERFIYFACLHFGRENSPRDSTKDARFFFFFFFSLSLHFLLEAAAYLRREDRAERRRAGGVASLFSLYRRLAWKHGFRGRKKEGSGARGSVVQRMPYGYWPERGLAAEEREREWRDKTSAWVLRSLSDRSRALLRPTPYALARPCFMANDTCFIVSSFNYQRAPTTPRHSVTYCHWPI